MRKIFSTILLLQILPISVFANELIAPVVNQLPQINCNDYYKEDDLKTEISIKESDIKAGDKINFLGTVFNKNTFASPNTDIYIRVVNKDKNVVDQFFAVEDKLIPGKMENIEGKVTFDFAWGVPLGLQAGEYKIYSYTTSNHQLNDNYLINDSASALSFYVKNQIISDLLEIDKDTITLNNIKYSKDLVFKKDEDITVSFDVKNLSNNSVDGLLNISSYYNNIGDISNNTNTNIEYFTLEPKQSKRISYIDKSRGGKTIVLSEVNFSDTKSIVETNLLREGYVEARISSVGSTIFPVKENTNIPVYVCVNSGNSSVIKDANIDISIIGDNNTLLYSGSIKTDITQAVSGYLFSVDSIKENSSLKIVAKIIKDNTILDQRALSYSPSEIKPIIQGENNDNREIDTSGKIGIIAITLIMLFGLAAYLLGHKKKTFPNNTV